MTTSTSREGERTRNVRFLLIRSITTSHRYVPTNRTAEPRERIRASFCLTARGRIIRDDSWSGPSDCGSCGISRQRNSCKEGTHSQLDSDESLIQKSSSR